MQSKQSGAGNWSHIHPSLLEILDTAMTADNASKGNIQLWNTRRDALEIVAQRGFDPLFLQTFQSVRADEPSACGRALRQKRQVMISDVTKDAFYAPYVSVASGSGFRSVQSTPIFNATGHIVGVLSTHFAEPHRLSETARIVLEDCARRVAQLLAKLDPS